MSRETRERRVLLLIRKDNRTMETEEAKENPDFEKINQSAREKYQLMKKTKIRPL